MMQGQKDIVARQKQMMEIGDRIGSQVRQNLRKQTRHSIKTVSHAQLQKCLSPIEDNIFGDDICCDRWEAGEKDFE